MYYLFKAYNGHCNNGISNNSHFVMWHTKLYNLVDYYGISTEGKHELKIWFMLTRKLN